MRISDWSSDVCSSDLLAGIIIKTRSQIRIRLTINQNMIFTIIPTQKSFPSILLKKVIEKASKIFDIPVQYHIPDGINRLKTSDRIRSEERRVGKACVRPCNSRWWPSN